MTEEALEGSIKKWKAIVRSTKAVDKGMHNCALCIKYGADDCIGCPVQKKTSNWHCADTPYSLWQAHQRITHGHISKHRTPHCKTCLRLAREEVAFLESLRKA